MLKLTKITKEYKTSDFSQLALAGVDLEFVEGDFVSILGPSGCGKTTMLNIIGGLDRYSSGDLEINGKSTKKFKEQDWDGYRNNAIGFVFQSYNLINHASVLDNVELGMKLSGISRSERIERAKSVLERVGLKDHINKSPNQLSGGQKQRVAIARALANDPKIILADEPTGALDSKTSVEIIELIKEISKDKLVIMVTHNSKIAKAYSTRIVELKDGLVISDSKPTKIERTEKKYQVMKTSMNFVTALKLSFNNLRTKFKRTLITSFAGSIGIVGVALVLSISNGMNAEISSIESDQLAGMPIMINESPQRTRPSFPGGTDSDIEETKGAIKPYDITEDVKIHKNKITNEYIDYVKDINIDLLDVIQYQYGIKFNLFTKMNGSVISIDTGVNEMGPTPGQGLSLEFSELPSDSDIITENYEVVAGTYPKNYNELIIVVDEYNRIDQNILATLGIDVSNNVEFEELIGKEIIVATNDFFYIYNESLELYVKNDNLEEIFNNGISTKIVGIIRPIPESTQDTDSQINNFTSVLSQGVWYTNQLTEKYLVDSINSNISISQKDSTMNVITGFPFSEYHTKEDALKELGATKVPIGVNIYPKDFEAKEEIKIYLGEWTNDEIIYSDLAETITSSMSTMINMIQVVLVAFASISLVVSGIMIGIITYVSVIERTKEIGILRSLGASKKDIKRVFNAETFIVGLSAGVLGIAVTFLLTKAINPVLEKAMSIEEIARIDLMQCLVLIGISIVLTLFSGLIPASIASKKDPVEALRTD